MATRTKSRPAAEVQAAPAPSPVEETPRAPRRSGINHVTLCGRLTADPEIRYTTAGHAVATLRIATNDREEAEFHDVVVWRQLAETAAEQLTKGSSVYVEGRLHSRTWQAQDGTNRRTVEVVAHRLI